MKCKHDKTIRKLRKGDFVFRADNTGLAKGYWDGDIKDKKTAKSGALLQGRLVAEESMTAGRRQGGDILVLS